MRIDSTPASASAPSQAAIFELFSTIGSPPESRISRSFSRPLSGWTPPFFATAALCCLMYGMISGINARQFFEIAETAMGRAGRHDIHESHLVLVQQALDGAVVHLVSGILRARKIHRLAGVGLDDALNRGAGPGQVVVMARDLHGHPGFNVPIGALERFQPSHLVRGVEAE